jgi:DNA (cytosine-5)-methyltransferase 1
LWGLQVKFLSVCSGIEAASVAWQPLGWKAVAFSEIEPFPCAVLAHHYPDTPNWGDMTKFKEWPDVSIDLLCGGTPCQSFSIAGLRKGLDDPRGNLMLTFGAIAAKYRPQWLVWENVSGVLSSNGGADFGAFLGMLGQLGYGFAYRVLDAQYFGVAQRRRRVFVVGCFGDWRSAAAVLFERHSLQGHPAPSRQAGQRPTGTLSARTEGGGGLGTDFELGGGLVPESARHPLAAGMHAPAIAFQERGRADGPNLEIGGELAFALTAPNGGGRAQERNILTPSMQVRRLTPMECERLQGFPDGYTRIPAWSGWRKMGADETPEQLMAEGLEVKQNKKTGRWRVRDVNGPRYKALGNSWAVPNIRWIGERIQAVENLSNNPKTQWIPAQAAPETVAGEV